MTKKQEVSILKPTIGAAALGFAAGSQNKAFEAFFEAGQGVDSNGSKKRSFSAPDGYKRFTLNLPEAVHKRLKIAAAEQECTATEIVERLIKTQLGM